jgi:hypothetical protein
MDVTAESDKPCATAHIGEETMIDWLMARARRGRYGKRLALVKAEIERHNDMDRASVLVAAAEIGLSMGRGVNRAQVVRHLESPASAGPGEARALYKELGQTLADHQKTTSAEVARKRVNYGEAVAEQFRRDTYVDTLAVQLLMARLVQAFEPTYRDQLHEIARLLARGVPVLPPAIQRQKKRHALAGKERDGQHYDRLENSARLFAGNT